MEQKRKHILLRVITILILTSFTLQQASFADISYKITHDALSTGNLGDGQAPNAGEVDKTALATRLLGEAGLLRGDQNARQALIDFCLGRLGGQAAMRILSESGIPPAKITPIITRATDIRDQVTRAGKGNVDLGMTADGGEVDKAALAAQLLEEDGLFAGLEDNPNARQALIDFCLRTLDGNAVMDKLTESGVPIDRRPTLLILATKTREQVAQAGESSTDLGMTRDEGEEGAPVYDLSDVESIRAVELTALLNDAASEVEIALEIDTDFLDLFGRTDVTITDILACLNETPENEDAVAQKLQEVMDREVGRVGSTAVAEELQQAIATEQLESPAEIARRAQQLAGPEHRDLVDALETVATTDYSLFMPPQLSQEATRLAGNFDLNPQEKAVIRVCLGLDTIDLGMTARGGEEDAANIHESFNNGTYLRMLTAAHEARKDKIVQEGNEVLIVKECLTPAQEAAIRESDSTDIRIVSREEAIAAAANPENADRRIILTPNELGVTDETARCKVLVMGNYHHLHLPAAMELARSVLIEMTDAERATIMGEFFSVAMQRPITAADIEMLSRRIIQLPLPVVEENRLDDINGLVEEHLAFLRNA